VVGGSAAWAHRVAAAAGAADPDLADELESAAAEEYGRAQYAVAARYLRWAADLSPTRDVSERRLVRSFLYVQAANQIRRLVELRAELEACSPGTLRDLALVAARSTAGEAALETAHRVWRALPAEPDPRELAGFVGPTLPAVFLVWGDPSTASEICRWVLAVEGLGVERISGTRGLLAWATLVTAGPRAALRIIEETGTGADEIRPDNVQLIAVRGSLRVLDGELADGLADLHIALRYAREGRPIVIGRRVWAFTRWAGFLAGRWDESLLSPADAGRDAGSSLAWYDLPYEHLSRIWVLTARGDWGEARRHLDLIRKAALAVPGAEEHFCAAIARAVIAQGRGGHQEMHEALRPLRDSPATSFDHALTARWWLPLLAEAEIGTGRLDDAEETLRRLGDVDDVPYLRAQVVRLRASLAERRGDLAAALAVCEQAATVASGPDDAQVYRAQLLPEYGRLLRTAGHRRHAAERLHAAHAIFAGLGAAPFVDQCTEELARAGLHAPRQRTTYTSKLTDREREIANLIAMGKTNREISAELFVSAKTVEYHLANIYLKLNLSGRRELRDLVQHKATVA